MQSWRRSQTAPYTVHQSWSDSLWPGEGWRGLFLPILFFILLQLRPPSPQIFPSSVPSGVQVSTMQPWKCQSSTVCVCVCVCLFVPVVLLPITCPWSIIKLRYPNSPLKCWKWVGHSISHRSQLRGLGMFYFAPRLMPFMELAKCSPLKSCGLNNRVINTTENPFRNKNIFTWDNC